MLIRKIFNECIPSLDNTPMLEVPDNDHISSKSTAASRIRDSSNFPKVAMAKAFSFVYSFGSFAPTSSSTEGAGCRHTTGGIK